MITREKHRPGPGRREVTLTTTEGPVTATLIDGGTDGAGRGALVRVLSHPREWTHAEAYHAVLHAIEDGRIR